MCMHNAKEMVKMAMDLAPRYLTATSPLSATSSRAMTMLFLAPSDILCARKSRNDRTVSAVTLPVTSRTNLLLLGTANVLDTFWITQLVSEFCPTRSIAAASMRAMEASLASCRDVLRKVSTAPLQTETARSLTLASCLGSEKTAGGWSLVRTAAVRSR
ncbi:unnamed protein product [Urochloa humidicola]